MMLKSTSLNTDLWGFRHWAIDHHSLDTISQPVPCLLNNPLIKSILIQFGEKDAVECQVKGLTETHTDDIFPYSLTQLSHHKKSYAGSTLGEVMLVILPYYLSLFHMPWNSFQEDLLHDLPWKIMTLWRYMRVNADSKKMNFPIVAIFIYSGISLQV